MLHLKSAGYIATVTAFMLLSTNVVASDLGSLMFITAGSSISHGIAATIGAEVNAPPIADRFILGAGVQKESLEGQLTGYGVVRVLSEKNGGGWFSDIHGHVVTKMGYAKAHKEDAAFVAMGAGLWLSDDQSAGGVELTVNRAFGQIDRTTLMLNMVLSFGAIKEMVSH